MIDLDDKGKFPIINRLNSRGKQVIDFEQHEECKPGTIRLYDGCDVYYFEDLMVEELCQFAAEIIMIANNIEAEEKKK